MSSRRKRWKDSDGIHTRILEDGSKLTYTLKVFSEAENIEDVIFNNPGKSEKYVTETHEALLEIAGKALIVAYITTSDEKSTVSLSIQAFDHTFGGIKKALKSVMSLAKMFSNDDILRCLDSKHDLTTAAVL